MVSPMSEPVNFAEVHDAVIIEPFKESELKNNSRSLRSSKVPQNFYHGLISLSSLVVPLLFTLFCTVLLRNVT